MNRVIRRLTFGLLGFLLLQSSFSQVNFLPGQIVDLKGDPIIGFIDYGNWGNNPDKISFKENLLSDPVIYSPLDIKEFKVDDELYVSAIVDIEISPDKINELELSAEIKIRVDTVFLQAMILGNKSLYYFKAPLGKDLFYIGEKESINLLIYKKYLKKYYDHNTMVDDAKAVLENNTFIGQLTLYFEDCGSSLQSDINNATYNKKSLENLFLEYYNCSRTTIAFYKKRDKLITEFGIFSGLSLTNLNFYGENFDYLTKVDYPQSTDFSIGLYLDLILPRNKRRWSINNELQYSSYNVKGSYLQYDNENKYTQYLTEIGLSYIKLNNMLRYNLPIKHVFIFLNAGISNGFAISVTNSRIKNSKIYTLNKTELGLAIEDIRKREFCYNFGMGCKYKKLSFETRYEKGSGLSRYTSLGSHTTKYYFLLGYNF